VFLTFFTEIEKLARQRRTWMTFFFLNLVGIGLLLAIFLVPLLTTMDPDLHGAFREAILTRPEWIRGVLSWLVVLWANTFSILSTLFLALLAGSLVAGEFADDSIQIYMVAPISRARVWWGKVLAAFFFYLVAWALGLLVVGLTYWRACSLEPGLGGMLSLGATTKVVAAYALVDLSTLSFFLLVSTLTRGSTSATVSGLGLYILFSVSDFFFWFLHQLDAFPVSLLPWLDYTFTRTARVLSLQELSAFLRNPLRAAGFPIQLNLLGANAAWMALFLLLGLGVFSRREAHPEGS
jgi:ABC-type transport system involved in multi-copper enzyme maturation permease subunit